MGSSQPNDPRPKAGGFTDAHRPSVTGVKTVGKSAAEIPHASPADLDRLRAAMQGPIDTAEIPERRRFQRLKRAASGRLPPRRRTIRFLL